MSIPKKLLDAAIKNQTALDQYGHGLNRKIQKLLQSAENEIAGKIGFIDPTGPTMTAWRLGRLKALNQAIRDILSETFEQAADVTKTGLMAVATLQADHAVSSFNKSVGVDLFQITLTPTNLQAVVENCLIDGRLIGDWWSKQGEDLRSRMVASMREGTTKIQTGMVQGESIGELIGRIRGSKTSPGVMSISKRQAEALVRTSVMSVAGAARMQTFKKNSDVLDGIEVVATLDARTTPLCAALDGRRFDLDGNALDGGSNKPAGPPFHWNCRSTLVPCCKSFSELVGPDSPLSKKRIRQLEKAVPKGQRASLNGPIPVQTYDAWLRDQSQEMQREILGPARFELWKRNKLGMADLVNHAGQPLTLAELRQRLK